MNHRAQTAFLAKKQTRKFSYNKLFTPIENIVDCKQCGKPHQIDTLCGNCYQYIYEVTEAIKEKMMKYNPYVGERQDKEVHVRYEGDPEADAEVKQTKKVVEINLHRPIEGSAKERLRQE